MVEETAERESRSSAGWMRVGDGEGRGRKQERAVGGRGVLGCDVTVFRPQVES